MSASVADAPGGAVLKIRVIPRAARNRFTGTRGDSLLARVASPPVDGSANAALVELVAVTLDVPRRAVTVVAGNRSRDKLIKVEGVNAAEVSRRLASRMTT